MRSRHIATVRVYSDRPFDATGQRRGPETVPPGIESLQELDEIGSDLRLKELAEAPVLMIVTAVKFSNSTDGTGDGSRRDFYWGHTGPSAEAK